MTFISNKSGLSVSDEPVYRSNSGPVLLVSIIGFDLNSIDDNIIDMAGKGRGSLIITDVVIRNASVNIDTAKGFELWSDAGRTGVKQVTSDFGIADALQKLVDDTSYINKDNAVVNGYLKMNVSNKVMNSSLLYASIGTAQGSPATADVHIFGKYLV